MKKTSGFILLLMFICLKSLPQKQMNYWFFADGQGLDFSNGPPMQITGEITLPEGGSSVCDSSGNLLFYTDGYHVFDRRHLIMPNGDVLFGGTGSSTQSSLIVPKPGDNNMYYIFTTEEEGRVNGFSYSVIDMSLNAGFGAVTDKNLQLYTPVSEKIAATRHCNGRDIWVVTHAYGSDAFLAYLVTSSGVTTIPVVSHAGNFIPIAFYTMAGQLKISNDGSKIAAAHCAIGVDLLDFDNQTGLISNPTYLFDNSNSASYGVEFSPNSSVLYLGVSGWYDPTRVQRFSSVFQYDLSLPTASDIKNSKLSLHEDGSGTAFGSMQSGPDGKIYMCQYRRNNIAIIHSPNTVGTASNFAVDGIIMPKLTALNLPNFGSFYTPDSIDYKRTTGFCINDTVKFNYTIGTNITSVLWDFGDPASGANNTSSLPDPYHVYSRGGTYVVQLIRYRNCGSDTLKKTVIIGDVYMNLGGDTAYCGDQTIKLDPHAVGSNSYLWQNGATTPMLNATTAGLYWVEVKNGMNGCIQRDSIVLVSKPFPIVKLGNDTSLCTGQQVLLDAQNSGASYQWQNNSTPQTFLASQSGSYWVKVILDGCTTTDTIKISELSKPIFSLGPDQVICAGETVELNINSNAVKYVWQDGSTNPFYKVTKEGLYYADATNQCGTTRDSIYFSKKECIVYVPNAFTPNNDGLNDLFRVSGTGSIAEFEMYVYNRWGQLIYKTKDKTKGWNGSIEGSHQPAGLYVWVIKYKTIADPSTLILKGTVSLIR